MEQKPMRMIKEEKWELERKINAVCETFAERTGAAITRIEVSFLDTTSLGKGFSTTIEEVRVYIEEV